MKIRQTELADRDVLMFHLQELFGYSDSYLKAFFDHQVDLTKSYVVEDGGQIIGGILVNLLNMVMHQKVVKVAMCHHLFTTDKQSPDQISQTLINYLTLDLKNRVLFTCLYTKQASIFEPFGFLPVFQKKVYELKRSHIVPMDSAGVRLRVDYDKLVDLSHYFTQYFNGYFVYDQHYFQQMNHVLTSLKGNYITLLNQQENAYLASCRLRIMDQHQVVVDEVFYKDQQSLRRILSFVLAKYPKIKLTSSIIEDFEQTLGARHVENEISMLVLLNQPKLFSKLYNVDVKRADSAIKAFSKPLFNTVFYG